MPEVRPTFVVNFDMATVICQHTEDPEDLHLHEISILCDGKNDCFMNPAMSDESFPYCERKCNSTCNDRGACLYDGQNAQCYCNAGFHGPSCELPDVNECVGKPCHWLAHCQNTFGSYSCQCFNGFYGDGFSCTDIDECAVGKTKCPENSICVNLPGTYMCNCTEGYMPKGMPLEKCADIDECALKTHDCPVGKMCENVIGGYACVDSCDDGYEAIDGSCIDINECNLPNPCDKRAICTNTPGGHECTCEADFTGDGHTCFPLMDCSQNDAICDRHGFCLGPLKTCMCQTGYTGDGMSCTDINECETGANPCSGNVESKCVNIEGGYVCCDETLDNDVCVREKGVYCAGGCGTNAYCINQTCACLPGFAGNPHERCLDVNECENANACPGVGQICVNMIGGHTCCGPDSPQEECKGLEIVKDFGNSIEIGEKNSIEEGDSSIESGGTKIIENVVEQKNASGGFVFLASGKNAYVNHYNLSLGKHEFETLSCNETDAETTCPEHADCVYGQCKCRLGFEWRNYPYRCEDINECVRLEQPCPEGEGWCMNTIGSYRCCMSGASSKDCRFDVDDTQEKWKATGNGDGDNEGGGEIVNETFVEAKNREGGDIVVTRGKVRIGPGIGLGGLPLFPNTKIDHQIWLTESTTAPSPRETEEARPIGPDEAGQNPDNLESPNEPLASTSVSIIEENRASGGSWFGIRGKGLLEDLKNLLNIQRLPTTNDTIKTTKPDSTVMKLEPNMQPFGPEKPQVDNSQIRPDLGRGKTDDPSLFGPNEPLGSTSISIIEEKHSSGGSWFGIRGNGKPQNATGTGLKLLEFGPDGIPEVGADGSPKRPGTGPHQVVSDRNPHGPKIGPDGRLVEPKDDQNGLGPSQLGPDGKPLENEPDGTPEIGPDGRPIRPGSSPSQLGPDGNLLGPKDGQHRPKSALVGPDGKPLGLGPDGTRPGSDPSQVEPDGSPIGPNGRGPKSDQFGPDGHPLSPNNGKDGPGPKLAQLGPDGRPLGPNNGQDGTGPELVHLGPDGNPIPSKSKPTENQQSPRGKENENPPKNPLLNPDGTLHKPNFIKPKYGPDGRLEGLEIPEEFQHFLKHNEPLWNSPDLGLEENPVPNKIPEASLELVPGRQEIEGKTNEPKPNSDNMLNSEKPHQNPQEPHDLEHPNSPRPTWKTSAGDTFEIISGPNGNDWTIPSSKESTGGEIPEAPEEEELGLEISAKDFKPQPSHVGVTIKGDEINGPVEIPEAEETSSKENLKPTTPTIEIDEAENFTFGSREGELMPKSGTTSEGIPENPETTTGVLDSSAPSRAPLSSSEFSKLTSEAPTPASEASISTSESPKLTSEASTSTSKALRSTSAAPISTYEPPRLNSKALLSTSESPKLIVPQSSTVPTKEAANGKPDHLETSTLVNPNIEIDDGGEILSSSKENEHKPVSISTSLPEEIDNATKKSMSTPEITNITSEPSGSTEVKTSGSTPGIGVTTPREAEILKSASQTSSPIVSESETTVLTTTEEDITRKVTEIPQTISSKPRDDSRPEADGNFEASSSPSLLPTKSTDIEKSGQSTSPSKESPQTGITTSSSKPKDGSIPEVDWTSKTPSKTSILPNIGTENTEKLGFRQTTSASIISSTLPQAEESPKITTPPQEPIITISQKTLSPTFEVEIIKSTEKTPIDPSILLTFSTPGFEPTESETTSTGVSERKSSPTEPEKVEEFTATMPFEEIESVSKKLTTIRFTGPIKITNMHEEIDVTSAIPLKETNQTAVPLSSQETISTKKENSLDTTTISTQPTLRGDQTEIPETRFTPNTSPRFSSHAVKVETIESLTTDEVEQGASSTTTRDFEKMTKLEKQTESPRTTSEEPSLALGTTSSHATELEGQGSGNPDSSTPTTTQTISTSLPLTEEQGTKNKEPMIPKTKEITSSSSISPPAEKLTTLNSGTVRAGPEEIEPDSTKTDQEKLSPHSTTLAVQEESTSGGLPPDGLEQLTTTSWPKKISPPSITPSITDFDKHPENFKEKVEPLIPNSEEIQGNTEIQLQSTGIPLKSTEIPVRVTEIPLEGTEIPLEGTESPFEEEFGLEIGPLFKKPRPRLQKTTLGADQVKLQQEEDPSASTLSTKQVTSSTEGTIQPFEATKLDALSTLTPSTLPLSSIPERTPDPNEVTKVYETSILSPKSTLSMHEHEPVSSTDGRETRFSTVSITLSTQFTSTETPKITPVSGKHEHEKPEENDERTNRPWPFLRTLPPASSTFATSPIFSSSTSPTVLSQSNATSSKPPSSNSVKLSMAPIKSDHQTTTHEPTLFISIHPQENETIDTELITQPPGILESTDEVSETSEKVTETKISETSEEKVTEKGVTEESATTAAVINVTSRIIPVETTSTGIPNLESSTEIEGFSTRPQGQETTKLEGVKYTTSIPEVLSTLSQNNFTQLVRGTTTVEEILEIGLEISNLKPLKDHKIEPNKKEATTKKISGVTTKVTGKPEEKLATTKQAFDQTTAKPGTTSQQPSSTETNGTTKELNQPISASTLKPISEKSSQTSKLPEDATIQPEMVSSKTSSQEPQSTASLITFKPISASSASTEIPEKESSKEQEASSTPGLVTFKKNPRPTQATTREPEREISKLQTTQETLTTPRNGAETSAILRNAAETSNTPINEPSATPDHSEVSKSPDTTSIQQESTESPIGSTTTASSEKTTDLTHYLKIDSTPHSMPSSNSSLPQETTRIPEKQFGTPPATSTKAHEISTSRLSTTTDASTLPSSKKPEVTPTTKIRTKGMEPIFDEASITPGKLPEIRTESKQMVEETTPPARSNETSTSGTETTKSSKNPSSEETRSQENGTPTKTSIPLETGATQKPGLTKATPASIETATSPTSESSSKTAAPQENLSSGGPMATEASETEDKSTTLPLSSTTLSEAKTSTSKSLELTTLTTFRNGTPTAIPTKTLISEDTSIITTGSISISSSTPQAIATKLSEANSTTTGGTSVFETSLKMENEASTTSLPSEENPILELTGKGIKTVMPPVPGKTTTRETDLGLEIIRYIPTATTHLPKGMEAITIAEEITRETTTSASSSPRSSEFITSTIDQKTPTTTLTTKSRGMEAITLSNESLEPKDKDLKTTLESEISSTPDSLSTKSVTDKPDKVKTSIMESTTPPRPAFESTTDGKITGSTLITEQESAGLSSAVPPSSTAIPLSNDKKPTPHGKVETTSSNNQYTTANPTTNDQKSSDFGAHSSTRQPTTTKSDEQGSSTGGDFGLSSPTGPPSTAGPPSGEQKPSPDGPPSTAGPPSNEQKPSPAGPPSTAGPPSSDQKPSLPGKDNIKPSNESSLETTENPIQASSSTTKLQQSSLEETTSQPSTESITHKAHSIVPIIEPESTKIPLLPDVIKEETASFKPLATSESSTTLLSSSEKIESSTLPQTTTPLLGPPGNEQTSSFGSPPSIRPPADYSPPSHIGSPESQELRQPEFLSTSETNPPVSRGKGLEAITEFTTTLASTSSLSSTGRKGLEIINMLPEEKSTSQPSSSNPDSSSSRPSPTLTPTSIEEKKTMGTIRIDEEEGTTSSPASTPRKGLEPIKMAPERKETTPDANALTQTSSASTPTSSLAPEEGDSSSSSSPTLTPTSTDEKKTMGTIRSDEEEGTTSSPASTSRKGLEPIKMASERKETTPDASALTQTSSASTPTSSLITQEPTSNTKFSATRVSKEELSSTTSQPADATEPQVTPKIAESTEEIPEGVPSKELSTFGLDETTLLPTKGLEILTGAPQDKVTSEIEIIKNATEMPVNEPVRLDTTISQVRLATTQVSSTQKELDFSTIPTTLSTTQESEEKITSGKNASESTPKVSSKIEPTTVKILEETTTETPLLSQSTTEGGSSTLGQSSTAKHNDTNLTPTVNITPSKESISHISSTTLEPTTSAQTLKTSTTTRLGKTSPTQKYTTSTPDLSNNKTKDAQPKVTLSQKLEDTTLPTQKSGPESASTTNPSSNKPLIIIDSHEKGPNGIQDEESLPPKNLPSTTLSPLPESTTTLETILSSKPANLSAELETKTTKDLFTLSTTTVNLETLSPRKVQCMSSNECGNDAYCERRTGACRCHSGFRGTPPNTPCIDVNECEENRDTCDITSRCENYIGGYFCLCAIGYRKSSNGTCVDINECEERTGETCDTNAICTNLEGSFACQCKPGYTGDGYTCIPMNKRHCTQKEWIQSDCGKNHLCLVDALGNRDCDSCKNGFVMRHGVCSDIDECASPTINSCHEDAVCHNTIGGYDCRCQPGYSGDGFTCTDVDECAHNPCHPQAACSNLLGSFSCQCPDGWAGDGFKECLNPLDKSCDHREDICPNSNNTACLSVRVADSLISICECLPNYRYNPMSQKCEDINECLENRHNCDPGTTICANHPGSYSCDCAAGYEGNGGVCVDVDECRRGIAGCHVNAYCINRVGSVGCQCAPGYTGDGVTCEPLTHDLSIPSSECPENWVEECKYFNKTCYIDDEEIPQCGACLFGFQPMDGKCVGVHGDGVCADPIKNDCHKSADCIDIHPGKHFCVCKQGFFGDGRHCDDVDECTIPTRKGHGVCDPFATCTNTEGGYECKCNEGYVGNGFKCTHSTNIHGGPSCLVKPNLCHKKAKCGIDGKCICLAGYEGDGINLCEPSLELKYNYTTITVLPHDENTVRDQFLATSTTPLPRCSDKDRTACHVLATCDLDVGYCVCRRGFVGDGVNSCTKIWEDCVQDTKICDSNAYCHQQSGQCRCNDRFIGDGIDCMPDKLDCRNNTNLCNEYGHCVGNRCVCKEGYTGDGITCMSLTPTADPTLLNCSLCDAQATCEEGKCSCKEGYFGNGRICVPDLEDCINYPGVCHINGHCNTEKRKCECRKGFIGNGMDCSIRISCKVDPSICHKEAACQLDGRCVCKKGLVGDGMDCRTIVSAIDQQASPTISPTIRFECPTDCGSNSECVNGACKCVAGYKFDKDSNCVDIDECDMGIANCHSVATCTNLNGSYQCKCPEGYGGDGKDCYQYDQILPGIKIQCLADGMRLILAEEHVPFEGRVFVRGQTDNPYCSKTFSPLKQTEDPPTFHIPIAQCDMQLEENDTLATTVVIQKHAVFITEKAYAYRLRCQYPTAVKKMMTHFNVSELTTESIYEHGGDPVCSLTVTNENNLTIDSATVGQILKLQLSVLPNKTYSILPRNCFAINLETGEKYSLTDAAGCAIDTMLFPEWTRVRQDMTEAVFRTFKWPDSSMIRFECDCSACIGMCPTVNCGRRRDALFKRRFRARFARAGGVSPEINDTIPESGLVEEFIDEDLSWLKNIAVGNSSKLAFSSVVLVNEDEEEQLAQRQLERWLAQGSNYEAGVLQEPSIEEQVCIRPMWLAICLLSLLISGSMLTSMVLCYRKRSKIKSRQSHIHHRRDPTTLSEDASAYLKF